MVIITAMRPAVISPQLLKSVIKYCSTILKSVESSAHGELGDDVAPVTSVASSN